MICPIVSGHFRPCRIAFGHFRIAFWFPHNATVVWKPKNDNDKKPLRISP